MWQKVRIVRVSLNRVLCCDVTCEYSMNEYILYYICLLIYVLVYLFIGLFIYLLVYSAFVLHDFLNNASHVISNGNEANLAAINKNKNYTVLDYMQKAHYQVYANKSEADWVTCRQCLEMVRLMTS